MTEKSANKVKERKRTVPKSAWPKGVSGNPAGRPKTGESWAELIKKVGEMTPAEAAKYCKSIAGQLAGIGDAVTLKEAVVLRVYTALLFEPQPGLFNAFMDRTEGKVPDKLEVSDWRKDAAEAGIDPDAIVKEFTAHMLPHD